MGQDQDFGVRILKTLEVHPEGLSFPGLQQASGLTKPQTKAGLRYLRLNKGRLMLMGDGIIRVAKGPEDGMRIVIRRLALLEEDVAPKLYALDRLVEEQGVSEELEELYRSAMGTLERIASALRKLDILDEANSAPDLLE